MIASLLDGVRASGNRDVCVKMSSTGRGYRLGNLFKYIYLFYQPLNLEFSPKISYTIWKKYSNCYIGLFILLGPFTVPVDEEVESQHMKFIQTPPRKLDEVIIF